MSRVTLRQSANVLIVDDHPLLREALALTIADQPEMQVCQEAKNEEEALIAVREHEPDLVLIDISLEDGNGIELVKRIKEERPLTRMLVISAYPEALYGERALRAGAMGFVSKQEPKETILAAIRNVMSGRRYVSPELAQRLIGQALGQRRSETTLASLTDRELEVFRLIGTGCTSNSIASQIGVSVHTVESYRARIKTKLALTNGTALQREAVRWVLENE